MALPKLFQRIFWHNNTTPAIQEDNLNAMSKGLSDVDDRVIGLAGTIMEDVPQIQEDIEELEADMALIDTKIASATAEANRATTAANNAAASVISAGNKALVSEGWAKGTQNGAAVGSSSPYYHNNAEYFKNQARSFTPQGYQDLVDDVDSLKETLTNFEESITGEVVDNEPYVLRQGLGNLANMTLVGGSLAWNQLIRNGNFVDTNNWGHFQNDWSVSNNILTLTSTVAGNGNNVYIYGYTFDLQANHKMLLSFDILYEKNITSGECNIATTDWSTNIVKSFSATANVWKRNEFLITKANSVSGLGFLIFPFKNPTASVGDVVKIKNVQLIDLTQMFGSTIADYIYSLEQATEGAGVAWFRKYFPNAYYGYQSGKIESVNPSSRKITGKNLLPMTLASIKALNTSGTWSGNIYTRRSVSLEVLTDDGGNVTEIKATGTATGGNVFLLLAPTTFDIQSGMILNGCPTGGGWSTYMLQLLQTDDTTQIAIDTGSGATISADYSDVNLYLRIAENATVSNLIFKPMLRLASDSTFEPYTEYSYSFDTSIQLRGIPKLVDNKLSYDGDIYTADGTVTRKYGFIQITSSNMVSDYLDNTNNQWLASCVLTNSKPVADINTKGVALCNSLGLKTQNDLFNTTGSAICIMNNGKARFTLEGITTFADMQTWINNHPTYLVYELATPTTESANPYQNPQRAFSDGTEEFVDYGVQSATRDVSIPVGNSTTYQLNETLPPTEDYVDGALKFKVAISALGTDESGRTTASRAYTAGEFFYKDGKMYKVLASIAQGATFTINTNCQQTTLFAELKALAQ